MIGEDSEITEKLSDIDLLVIDAEYFSKNDIARLRENGIREIYSYINIGSIESFRSYDTDFEKYTLGDYENWPEEKWIDVSAPEWQACTASRVDALVQKGVDGFFVDNTDVYYNYPQESIYDGILTILDYMNHTGRKIMINGGDCFVKKYLTTEKNVLIDGVNQENVFTAYDFSKDVYTKNDQSTREYYTEYLDLAMSHGCTAYTLEYATVPSIRRQATAYAVKHGYICYISDNIGLCLGR
ncbi:endo alpha-1,4 polygalactosaminidase [Lachnospiraceae bacterium CLA-AA-H183]